jgi:hypothetical protein
MTSAPFYGRDCISGAAPTRPTDALAQVIGFADVSAMFKEGRRIRADLKSGDALCKRDWQRALVAVEIVWASSVYGAAGDWEIVSTWCDEKTLRVLRRLQSKLAGLRQPPRARPTP